MSSNQIPYPFCAACALKMFEAEKIPSAPCDKEKGCKEHHMFDVKQLDHLEHVFSLKAKNEDHYKNTVQFMIRLLGVTITKLDAEASTEATPEAAAATTQEDEDWVVVDN